MRKRSALHGSLTIAAVTLAVACGDGSLPTGPSALRPSPSTGDTTQAAVQGKERVAIPEPPGPRKPPPAPLLKAVVTGELAVKELASSDPELFPYLFDITLTETAGVSATITRVSVVFGDGWGGQCSWTVDQFWQPNLPAKGTLTLEPLICNDWGSSRLTEVVFVSINLKDANGHSIDIYLERWLGNAAVASRPRAWVTGASALRFGW